LLLLSDLAISPAVLVEVDAPAIYNSANIEEYDEKDSRGFHCHAIFIAVLLLIGILIVNAAEKSIVKIPDPLEHRITLTDGLIMHTWVYPSVGKKPAPLMLLLPMMAHTHKIAAADDGAHAQKLRSVHRGAVPKDPQRQHLSGSDNHEL
jgi:hypothetical protein